MKPLKTCDGWNAWPQVIQLADSWWTWRYVPEAGSRYQSTRDNGYFATELEAREAMEKATAS